MTRSHGRAPRGRRLHMGQPYSHWKTSTFVAGLTLRGMIAPFVLDGPTNRLAFETYVEKVLVPELRAGDILIMANLSSHKGAGVRERIEAVGAELLFLPPYSPDLNPIEMAFSKLKALLLLRKRICTLACPSFCFSVSRVATRVVARALGRGEFADQMLPPLARLGTPGHDRMSKCRMSK